MAAARIRNLNALRCVAAQYDFAKDGGAVGDFALGIRIPAGALIIDAFAHVQTAATSADSTATIALKAESAGDLFAAAAVSGAPWSTTGRKQGVPDLATVGDTKIMTAEREITMSIAVQALTAGKINFFVVYVVNATA